MATPLQDDESQSAGAAGSTQASSGQVTTTPGTSGASAVSSGSTSPAAGSATAPTTQADVGKIENLNQGFDFSPLLNYVQGQGTTARNAISNANNSFNSALGSFNQFGQSDQDALNAVLNGQQPLSAGQALLNKSYGGPSSFDTTGYTPAVNNYVTSANETQNASGINTLLGQINPGLSAGDRAYDALVFGQNPTYQAQSRSLVNDANAVQGLGSTTASNAQSAISQRQNDIAAFNKAAQGYVQSQADAINQAINNQITQAGQSDQALMNDIPQLQSGAMSLSQLQPGQLAFDPTAFQAQTFTSPYGAGVFNMTVNPDQFLTFNPGALATRGNVATPQQAAEYNIAEQLLNGNDQLTAGNRQGATLGLNQAAFAKALADAQAQMQAADAAYLAAHQPTATGGNTEAMTAAEPAGGGSEGGGVSGDVGSGSAESEAAASQGSSPDVNTNGDTGIGGGTAGSTADNTGSGGSAGAAGSDTSGDTGGDDSFARGGVVRKREPAQPGDLKRGPAPNPLNNMGSRGAGPMPQIASPPSIPGMPQTGGGDSSSVLNPIGQLGYREGGSIPRNAGVPGVVDSVPINANAGEFVITKPSVAALGQGNLAQLNAIAKQSPAHQRMVRAALHAALNRAARG